MRGWRSLWIGSSLPSSDEEFWLVQQQLLPHVQRCVESLRNESLGIPEHAMLDHIHDLGIIYAHEGKLAEAEKMYRRALAGYEQAFGTGHTNTLPIINNLGILYANQGKLVQAEKLYRIRKTLAGYEKALGPGHTSTLNAVHCLGGLYVNQGKLKGAKEMYQWTLAGYENRIE